LSALAQVVQQQATVQAFVNDFWAIAMSFVAMLPLLLLIRAIKPVKADPAHAAME
jgi:hypothetical protein